MMQIPYLEPAGSKADIDKADGLVAEMKALIAVLTQAGLTPDNEYVLLDKVARQNLIGQGFSKTLVDNVAFFTEQVRVPQDGGFVERDQFMVGFTSDAFDSNLYASDAIKAALIKSHSGRCAYCETLINQTAYGDVEHFRPKAAYETSWSPALFRPGYYSLAYEPRTMLRFNPINGHAYPFDLVASLYAQIEGWGMPQTSAEIWKDPTKIPDQHDLNGVSISAARYTTLTTS
ncbi:hypothetical protein [Burkholderia glumae]|uniref:hypothetical protein n=2 Tax=Burkholderia glumae TaxID=337 RepID=UPI00030782D6|nr:hypothetical protein [Burkholderia glumae]MCM2491216.1 hypothetical protein [Burkholderia glumae]MCM2542209.1 hypothetical protein [Burkholderia glumae]MCQ0032112.1 hypothetical protein [Burkholderia glumae]MCQ0035847.1 hypothetical protein [Burkholderia glumae]QKM48397.1 hypothetical protein B7760_02432 [Burkholderia glumae]